MTIDYAALGQTDEEAALLREHDENEELHPFVPDIDTGGVTCGECGDTEEGLMHNNTWRNVEPLIPVQVDSPSGWSYMSTQENGDGVDCHACGGQIDDDYPIVNDDEGYAYHQPCLTVDVAVTYTFVVSVPKGYQAGDVSQAVEGYINSVGYALDNPVKVEEV